jgi:ketosteroid isomerase-like protein
MATVFTIANSFAPGAVILAEEQNENWEDAKDYFDALSSGANFVAGAILNASIADNAITTAKLATDAVTTAKITDANVTSAKLASSLTLVTPNIGAATGTSLTVTGTLTATGDVTSTGNVIGHVTINAQLNSYTLLIGDDGKLVEINNASPNTLTVPPDSTANFTIGTQILVLQTGAGQTTLTAGAGVTVDATPGLKLRTQYSSATLIKRAANTWVALGDLAS